MEKMDAFFLSTCQNWGIRHNYIRQLYISFGFSTQIENSRLHKSHKRYFLPDVGQFLRGGRGWLTGEWKKDHHSKLLSRNPCAQQWDVDIKLVSWLCGALSIISVCQITWSWELRNVKALLVTRTYICQISMNHGTSARCYNLYNLCRKLRARSHRHLRL